MSKVMLYRHRRNRRRFLAAVWIMLILTHFVVFSIGSLRGYDFGFKTALGMVEQEMRKSLEEKAGILRNVRGNEMLPSTRGLAF